MAGFANVVMVTEMDPTKLSQRTRDALDQLPSDKRRRAEAIIARTQTPEARARDAADRAILDREYRETGRIATLGKARRRDAGTAE
jgi:hypothetical protein